MTATSSTPLRIIATCTLAFGFLTGAADATHAAAPRHLTLKDFGNTFYATDVSGTADGTVSGFRYAHAIQLSGHNGTITYFTRSFPGYAALSFDIGIADSKTVSNDHCEFLLGVDGKTTRDIVTSYGHVGLPIAVPLANANAVTLGVAEGKNPNCDLVIGDPMAVPSSPSPTSTPGSGSTPTPGQPAASGTTGLQILSASVAAGGQETALVTAGAGASITLVIGYPDNTQQIVGPDRAGPDGRFTFIWTVPRGMQGATRIAAVSGGIAPGSFIIQ